MAWSFVQLVSRTQEQGKWYARVTIALTPDAEWDESATETVEIQFPYHVTQPTLAQVQDEVVKLLQQRNRTRRQRLAEQTVCIEREKLHRLIRRARLAGVNFDDIWEFLDLELPD